MVVVGIYVANSFSSTIDMIYDAVSFFSNSYFACLFALTAQMPLSVLKIAVQLSCRILLYWNTLPSIEPAGLTFRHISCTFLKGLVLHCISLNKTVDIIIYMD